MSAIHNVLAGCGDGYINATIEISSSVNNYILHKGLVSNYIAGRTRVTVHIMPGVIVGSSSSAVPAFIVPANEWNPQDELNIINDGYIVGKGGVGSQGVEYHMETVHDSQGEFWYNYPTFAPSSGPGGNGGAAIRVESSVKISNFGVIGGGGGGGAYGAWINIGEEVSTGGGGGGAGFGSGGPHAGYMTNGQTMGTAGQNGSLTQGGSFGFGGANGSRHKEGQSYTRSGYGGNLGQPGETRIATYYNYTSGNYGGAAGAAVIGNSNINWIEYGARYGAIT